MLLFLCFFVFFVIVWGLIRLAEDDWDSRNLLYSLRFNTCAATLIPGSNYREQ